MLCEGRRLRMLCEGRRLVRHLECEQSAIGSSDSSAIGSSAIGSSATWTGGIIIVHSAAQHDSFRTECFAMANALLKRVV